MARLLVACVGEVLGTFLLVLFGCGAVHASVLSGTERVVAGGHRVGNRHHAGRVRGRPDQRGEHKPAITIALAAARRFPARRMAPYLLSQLAGMPGSLGGAAAWSPWIADVERERGIIRGEPSSVNTAMCYGEYFPNPDAVKSFPTFAEASHLVSHATAFGIEFAGTWVLAIVVFSLTDERTAAGRPRTWSRCSSA